MFGNLTWPFTTSRCEGLSGKKRQCHWLDLQCQRFDGNDQKSITRSLGLSHWAWTNQSTWGSQKKKKNKQKRSIRVTLMTITPRNGWQNRRIVCTKWKLMAVNSVAYRDFWLLTSKMVPWKWPAFIQKFDYHLNQRILWISRGYITNFFFQDNEISFFKHRQSLGKVKLYFDVARLLRKVYSGIAPSFRKVDVS